MLGANYPTLANGKALFRSLWGFDSKRHSFMIILKEFETKEIISQTIIRKISFWQAVSVSGSYEYLIRQTSVTCLGLLQTSLNLGRQVILSIIDRLWVIVGRAEFKITVSLMNTFLLHKSHQPGSSPRWKETLEHKLLCYSIEPISNANIFR